MLKYFLLLGTASALLGGWTALAMRGTLLGGLHPLLGLAGFVLGVLFLWWALMRVCDKLGV